MTRLKEKNPRIKRYDTKYNVSISKERRKIIKYR